MYKLYNYQTSGNCYKIRLLLHQLGLPFESIAIDILKGESRTPEFLQKNPNGRVPVLEVDGKYLAESNAAIWFLAVNTPFLPAGKFEQAQVLQWMFFEQYSHEPFIATSRFWLKISGQAEKYADQLAQKKTGGYAALDIMEKHLQAHNWFVGNNYSIADIALYAYTHVADEGGFELSGYPGINRWLAAVAEQTGHRTLVDS